MEATTKTPKTDALIARLTLDDAIRSRDATDKVIWIETIILDAENISRRMAHRVEDALIAILNANNAWV